MMSEMAHVLYYDFFFQRAKILPSSETKGRSVGSEKAGPKFAEYGQKSPWVLTHRTIFQKFKLMPASDWAQKMLCIIVPNRRTVSPEFFS